MEMKKKSFIFLEIALYVMRIHLLNNKFTLLTMLCLVRVAKRTPLIVQQARTYPPNSQAIYTYVTNPFMYKYEKSEIYDS